jgi:hypothetical protein
MFTKQNLCLLFNCFWGLNRKYNIFIILSWLFLLSLQILSLRVNLCWFFFVAASCAIASTDLQFKNHCAYLSVLELCSDVECYIGIGASHTIGPIIQITTILSPNWFALFFIWWHHPHNRGLPKKWRD